MTQETRKAPALFVLAFVLALIGVQLWQGFKGFDAATSPLAAPGALLGWGGVLVLVVLFGWLLAGWWGRDLFGLSGATGLAVRVLGVVALGVAVAGLAGLAGGEAAGGDVGNGLAGLLGGLLGKALATLLLLLMAIPGLVLAAAPFFRTATAAPPPTPDLQDAVASLDPPPGVFEGSGASREGPYPERRYDEDGNEIPLHFQGRDVGPVRYADEEEAEDEVQPPAVRSPVVPAAVATSLPAGVRYADEEEEEDEGPAEATVPHREGERLPPGVRYADEEDEEEEPEPEEDDEEELEDEEAEDGLEEDEEEDEDEDEAYDEEEDEDEDDEGEYEEDEDEYEEEDLDEEEDDEEELEDEEGDLEEDEDEDEDEYEEDDEELEDEDDEAYEDEEDLEDEEESEEDELEEEEPEPDDEEDEDGDEFEEEEPAPQPKAPAPRTPEEEEEAKARYRAKLEGSGFFDDSEPVPPPPPKPAPKRKASTQGKGGKAAGKASGAKAASKPRKKGRKGDEHPPLPLADPDAEDEPEAPPAPRRKGSAALSDEELIDRAVRVALERGAASSVLLSRRLGIGYARARALMDVLVKRGVLGNMGPSGSRPVQITLEDWESTSS